ncbi:MAG: phosphoribosylanthranilate isomerase [Flexilinea sp.]|nr:phosphoribosylanthranilate isomerase [Flexilinea sp.]
MTKIKLCGMKRAVDIQAANRLRPDFVGFVFAPKSKRFITPEQAAGLKAILDPEITAVGVFVNETPEAVADLLNSGVIDIAQLHGTEDEDYLSELRKLTDKPLIKAFRIRSKDDLDAAEKSSADFVLLDAGAGGGKTFDWDLLDNFSRPCFLAGGLGPENVREAIERCHPYAVDVSSGIETDGFKDEVKMEAFVKNVKIVK